MTYIRAWMSLKFGQIRLLVSMATDSVIMEKTMLPLFLGCFYPILFILAGNDDMHESLEEFEFRPDLNTDCGVSCLLASEKNPHRLVMGKNCVATFSQLFLIKSFSYLQVTMTYIRAWMSSKLGQIRSRTTELAALEHLKNQCCPLFSFHSCSHTWEIVR